MCRLYALKANEPTKVECSLVHAQNALLTQSIYDQRGESHADGWGISCYENGLPRVEKRATAAHQDEHFSLIAERLYAKIVIAHVRQATVGAHSAFNTHPFIFGPWTFAHNGTLAGFKDLESQLVAESDPDLLAYRAGETDSEVIFHWLMTRFRRQDGSGQFPDPGFERVLEILQEAISLLDSRSCAIRSQRTTRLNFLLSNGRELYATCLRNSLYMVTRPGVHDCEICGIPHIDQGKDKHYRAVVLASEPISDENWRQVPDGSVVGVDTDLGIQVLPI